jgi:hypothetical protein
VRAIAVSTSTVYVGGDFTQIFGDTNHPHIAELDRVTESLTAWSPGPSDSVYALALSTSTIYVGGAFDSFSIDDSSRSYLAEIDRETGIPTAWNPNPDTAVLRLA